MHNIFILCLNIQKINVVYVRFLVKITLGGQWQPLTLTRIGQYNVDFLKVRTTSNKVMQRKSIFFAGTLNFFNKILFWLCVTEYMAYVYEKLRQRREKFFDKESIGNRTKDAKKNSGPPSWTTRKKFGPPFCTPKKFWSPP